ncbi:hypothetical protein [Aquimarina muelleri]|uniref:Dihydrolipoamide dehydrogenase n=1 Tax=Aquimarina muelleri TaxID=279356 RepID=A0A918JU77_9FLAO|nr:hypothetical protein [Aquimarina muelleri]MCX2763040.1 hypothetical protein [Aquimarina muelleri]GGX03250.1 hypothetical protein GCM10007384_01240 [Aquimarina muelleri]
MKKILTLLFLATLMLTSCRNDDDVDFDTIGQTFEIDRVNFVTPEFVVNIPYPESIQVFDADVVLVYRLEEVIDGREVWEPLPTAPIFLNDVDNTTISYRFNFTSRDIDIYLESNNRNLTPPDLYGNQVFRIVVVPSAFAKNTKVDLLDFNAVQSALHLEF